MPRVDEATSALDATSRVLVFEAIKRWRANKTTIVITHDLSQISSSDFVYVLKGGHVVEQGYRYDLEVAPQGEFKNMMESQGATGGFLPEKEVKVGRGIGELDVILEEAEKEKEAEMMEGADDAGRFNLKHQSLARPALRPVTLGNWMFEAVQNLTRDKEEKSAAGGNTIVDAAAAKRRSRFVPPDAFAKEMTVGLARRPSSTYIPSIPSPAHTISPRPLSLQFTLTSPTLSRTQSIVSLSTTHELLVADDTEFDAEKWALNRVGEEASLRRAGSRGALRTRWDEKSLAGLESVKVKAAGSEEQQQEKGGEDKQLTFWQLVREIYPTVPYKYVILLGLLVCVLNGAATPVFSFLLSRLMFEVSIGATHTSTINMYGGIVLAIAALDGLLLGLKYFIMETVSIAWVTKIRNICYKLVLSQDKKWFDGTENSPVKLVQILIKDGDDARTLIATVLAQFVVVFSMFSVGLLWALVRGWQLTLVGFAIAPVFAVTMAVQTNLVSKCELRNKRARENVAKGYYEVRLF
jgi:ATP-binding cassette subfamily B (MDR/TAP) protein 1